MNNRGQMSVENIFAIIMAVAAYAVLSPVLSTFIELGQNNSGTLASTILSFIPAFIIFAIVKLIFTMSTVHRYQEY